MSDEDVMEVEENCQTESDVEIVDDSSDEITELTEEQLSIVCWHFWAVLVFHGCGMPF